MYVQYENESEIKELDQNAWPGPIANKSGSVSYGYLGKDLYTMFGNGPRRQAYQICEAGRDVDSHYIIGLERDSHPDHSSRFGYARCRYGYCFGHMPGKYIENDHCAGYDPLPSDMAPERFYTEKYTSPFSCISEGRVNYDIGKNYLMRAYGRFS
jgi:hypothetical protein